MARHVQALIRFVVLASAALPGPVTLTAQRQVSSTLEAAYTSEQAESGEDVYAAACSECHLENLRGDFEAPELAGASLRGAWAREPVLVTCPQERYHILC